MLVHPDTVKARLQDHPAALANRRRRAAVRQWHRDSPVRFDTTTRADIVEVIPGVRRVDGRTVECRRPCARPT
jgi:D-aminopeptidase